MPGHVLDAGRAWPPVLARGVVAVAFGVVALIWPGLTVLALAVVFGIWAFVDGAGALVQAFRPGDAAHRLAYALFGLLGLVAGVLALAVPGLTVLVLATVVGAWAVVSGVSEIVAAIRLRKQITGEVFLGFAGVVSVIAGVLVLIHPIAGVFGIALLVGIYALLHGATLVGLAVRLRRLGRLEEAAPAT